MRKLLFIFGVAATLASCGEKKFSVSGKFENAAGETVVLQRMSLNSTELIDSIKINKDGSFNFKDKALTEPTFFQLTVKPLKTVVLLLDSTENAVVAADLKSFDQSLRITQSEGSQELLINNNKASQLQKLIQNKISELEKVDENDKAKQLEIQQTIAEEVENYKKFIRNYVMEHPRSFVSYYALFQSILNFQVFDVMDPNDHLAFATLATSLNLFFPEAERTKHLYNYVLQAKTEMKRQKITDQLMSEADHISIPEIEENDVNGNKVKLSDMKGKVVLLSFWAAWDEASTKENKNILKIYNKYSSKGFDVFQVSLDKSKVMWQSAIQKDNLPWTNVSDLHYTSSYWARLYNVSRIPSNFLINKKGELIGKDLYGTMLDEKVAEALK